MYLADGGKAGAPWLTYSLLTALAVMFGCELILGLDPPTGMGAPSVRTLVMLGGSNRDLVVAHGEWYRMISAAFLHAGVIHLALNGFALMWAGPLLEGVIGRAWFAAVYGVSAVAGSVVSLALNPPSVVSVGASGALMGMDACLFIVSFHFSGPMRAYVQSVTLQALLAGLIPIATSAGRVDIFAHLGGMLGGALVGLILIGHWPDTARLPRLQWLAGAIATAGLAAVVATAWLVGSAVFKARHELDLRATLIPNGELPLTNEDMRKQADALAARYPHDPRPRLSRGIALIEAQDFAGAERELRASLADAEALKDLLRPRVDMMVRTNLAVALRGSQKAAEARTRRRAGLQSRRCREPAAAGAAEADRPVRLRPSAAPCGPAPHTGGTRCSRQTCGAARLSFRRRRTDVDDR
jgi:rhomboid protease GluP